MATAQTITEGVESKIKVTSRFELFDFIFLFGGIAFAFITKIFVHEHLVPFYYVYCFLMAAFLTARSPFNKRRRNFESLYFLIIKDVAIYRPHVARERHEG